jgi:hypothetical protein
VYNCTLLNEHNNFIFKDDAVFVIPII